MQFVYLSKQLIISFMTAILLNISSKVPKELLFGNKNILLSSIFKFVFILFFASSKLYLHRILLLIYNYYQYIFEYYLYCFC